MAAHKIPIELRFWPKVNKTDTCWLWTGGRIGNGYGSFRAGGYSVAHRYSYELVHGAIPAGMTLDHLCRVRHCVNPAHLEVVTNKENIRRGTSPSALNALKTHCPSGHEYTEGNVYRVRGHGRGCRICNNIRRKRSHAQANLRPIQSVQESPEILEQDVAK